MKVLLVIALIAIMHQTAYGLNCYYCIGSTRGDCAQGKQSGMIVIPCGPNSLKLHSMIFNQSSLNAVDDLQGSCVRFVEPLPGNGEAFARGCAVLSSSIDPCDYISQRLNGSKCKSCTTSLCNKS